MPNTISLDLILPVLRDAAIVRLSEVLAPLTAYTRDFGTEPLSPHVEVRVPLASATPTLLVDGGAATAGAEGNFEQGDSTLAAVKIAVKQYSKCFHVVNRDLQDGIRLNMLAEANAIALGEGIAGLLVGLMNVTNFPNPVTLPVSEWKDGAGMKALLGAIEKARNPVAILDTHLFAEAMITGAMSFVLSREGAAATSVGPAAYGFSAIYRQTLWTGTGAAAGLAGFACDPQAIACASGPPLSPAQVEGLGVLIAQDNIMIPGINLTVQSNVWLSTKTRTLWGSYDIMFGCAVGDATAGVLVIPSGATTAAAGAGGESGTESARVRR
jgi:hypothetical protein